MGLRGSARRARAQASGALTQESRAVARLTSDYLKGLAAASVSARPTAGCAHARGLSRAVLGGQYGEHHMAFDPRSLQRQLSNLTPLHRVAFCASCSQRMLPNYDKFHRIEDWGNPHILRQALHDVWAFLQGQVLTADRIEALARQCMEAAPDTEAFSSLYASSALDAASATVETLRCCTDGDPKRGVRAATSARDTVDMYIQMRDKLQASGPSMEEAIARDPLMVREVQKQDRDLEQLEGIPALTPEFLARLRQSSSYHILSGVEAPA